MRNYFFSALAILGTTVAGYAQNASPTAAVSSASSDNNKQCYFYSVKEGNAEVKISASITINQSIALVTIYREIHANNETKNSMTQEIKSESTVHNGKIFFSAQKPIARAEDGSLIESGSASVEQEIILVDKNSIVVDGKTLTKGTCK